ncbi:MULTISPECIES: MBL fold metallo-hydrolase [Proteus]|uniref:MBL fold metallo-hydrolase n=1 Tax=Proteus penneri TaxID=102862 RepID=A0ABS0W2X6_9GAMM|nr:MULTISPECIES: MBL fold metallo-hydrolase [Proteus]MBJ2116526.1 MBL fold metallo-hydrolase [Proteus penneri]NBN03700.1 MBL fold metallo-hydrolase [Proteus sp. G2665]SUC00909.1 Predicted metal-dependent RNase, consists of a metallo-beta-lactamase domain and an RNA-binding KH domain [Proteus penneri]
MIRTFHSIGQGAFYTEKSDDFNFVYDCGTHTDGKKRIEKYVRNHFKKDEVINFLFISHFHEDHINGLEYLLSNYAVENVFIPQYSIYEHVLEFMYTDRNLSLFDNNLILNPEKAIESISPQTRIILVREQENNDENNDNIIDIERLSGTTAINSGCLLGCNDTNDWVFIPINYKNKKNSDLFKKNLKKEGVIFNDTSEFITSWSDVHQRRKIIDAFKKLPKNQNENSMVVYSGPKNNNSSYMIKVISANSYYYSCYFDCIFNDCFSNRKKTGCIYFGDYETHDDAWNTIKRALGKYYDFAGTIQIPHHGSTKNYRNEINKNDYVFSVISYGTTNTHGHPGSFTTESILNNNGILLEVTENPSSRLHFVIDER